MTWHKWLVRGLVSAALAAIVLGCGVYAHLTSPANVRLLVQEKLGVRFQHVSVQLDSASVRLLGGIRVNELRMSRNNGLASDSFLYVPTALIRHDKEQLLDGHIAIRKVELERPTLRLVRERDGKLNLAGILGPVDLSEAMPTVVIRSGRIVFEDRVLANGSPLLEINNVSLTLINDPLPLLQIDGAGEVDVFGPVRFRATVPRETMAAAIDLELPTIPVGSDLIRRVGLICPDMAGHLASLSGTASVSAKLKVQPESAQPIRHEVTLLLKEGRFSHPQLPASLENIRLEARLKDNVLPSVTLKATSGSAQVDVDVRDCRLPNNPAEADLEELAREFHFSVVDLPVTDEALSKLPAELQFIKDDFSPQGPISIAYDYQRDVQAEEGKRLWTIRSRDMKASYIDFPYPIAEVAGSIQVDTTRAPLRNIRVDLTGKGGQSPVQVKGHIRGDKRSGEVVLDVAGQNVLLDDKIMTPLPLRARKVVAMFLSDESRKLGLDRCPLGKADFHVAVRRKDGAARLEKTYTVAISQASVKYDAFPYPLEEVSGLLVLHPDHWEARGVRGTHAGGEMFIDGRSQRLPDRRGIPGADGDNSTLERVSVTVRGKNILLDRDFEQALSPPNGTRRALGEAWRTLALGGRLGFTAEVTDSPDGPQDVDVSVDVQGITMRPAFFDYALDRVSGTVRYARDRVYLREMRGWHGEGEVGLASGLIQIKPEGGFTAWLNGLSGKGLVADAELVAALPEAMKRGFEALKIQKPLHGAVNLTIVSPPGVNVPPRVWWESGLDLRNNDFTTGAEITEATGRFFCKGYFDGQRLRGASGELVLERATLFNQPLTDVRARLEVRSDSPDVLRIRDLSAKLFGGRIGGEARIETAGILRYEVLLEALGIQLDVFGRHNLGAAAREAQLQGGARAAVHLLGEGDDLLGLRGNGRVDVPQGKMGRLPVLLDLIKAFGLRMPDRTAFEEGHMLFSIEGPRVHVQSLDLFGNAISLQGRGSTDLDGSNLNLEFTATPGRMTQMLPGGVDLIPQMISQQLFKIKMSGKLGKGDLKFDKELMPGVVEPLRKAIGG